MTAARHAWKGGTCTRHQGPLVVGACPRSPEGKPCEPSTCSRCSLERRRLRFEAGPEVGDELPIDPAKQTTEYLTPAGWLSPVHVPPCEPATARDHASFAGPKQEVAEDADFDPSSVFDEALAAAHAKSAQPPKQAALWDLEPEET